MTFEQCRQHLTAIRSKQGTDRPLIRVDFAGTAFSFYFGKRRAKGARHFVLGNDAAQFLGGESKQREIFRLDSLG